ncbi:Serine/threonine-protein phosphatase 2A 65 kDa regulatory subunit A beta isoform [Vitis vinifera]|uniref:Serine/threonine-protein phosphatase 2A 65 kDa regulatory subunit A beta isoform n=1 Tax=Vitis vinifera TaxID=29760 RepID=A0A438JYI9_VITVI|nr:Serine/threonine-protein phosphatase 2A 65 kDa regulatory subunit A beta isoform [Vitis vinifera]
MDTSVFGQVDGLVSINSVSLLHSTMLNWPQDVQLVWANTKMCVGGAPLGSEMAMIDEPLYPIAVLIDELKNEDIQLRLNSIRRLSTIARALGEERTRKELIPFLSENNDDDDEVLLAMAEELGIGAQMREPDLVESFIPLVKRLAAGEWFTARVSSCGLFHIAYPSAPETLKLNYEQYIASCVKMTCNGEEICCIKSGKFAATVEAAHLKADIMSIFEDLTQDDQDSVRLLAVEGCAALGKLLEPQDCGSTYSSRNCEFLSVLDVVSLELWDYFYC